MRTYALLALMLFLGVAPANAQQVESTELEALKARLDTLEMSSCSGCYEACCESVCCRSAGFFAGAEVCFLEANGVNGTFNAPFDYQAASRFWLGYSMSNGLGFQTRLWTYDHSGESWAIFASDLDLSVFDIEVTNVVEPWEDWDLFLTAGYRHVNYRERSRGFEDNRFVSDNDGLTISGELRRSLCGNLFAFGGLRGSMVFGDDYRKNTATFRYRNSAKFMCESQLGLEWRLPLANGGAAFLRGAAETQYWNGFSAAGPHDGIAFLGGTFALGVQR